MAKFEPKILKNNTDHKIEFMCGGRIYIYEPGEKRLEEGFVAYHALFQVNTGLTDVTNEKDEVKETLKDDSSVKQEGQFSKMKWVDLLKLVGNREWWKPGMNRQEIEKALEDESRRENQTIQGTAPEEKG